MYLGCSSHVVSVWQTCISEHLLVFTFKLSADLTQFLLPLKINCLHLLKVLYFLRSNICSWVLVGIFHLLCLYVIWIDWLVYSSSLWFLICLVCCLSPLVFVYQVSIRFGLAHFTLSLHAQCRMCTAFLRYVGGLHVGVWIIYLNCWSLTYLRHLIVERGHITACWISKRVSINCVPHFQC